MALPEPIPRREIILDVTSTAVDYEIPFPFIFDMDVEIAVSTVASPNTFSRLAYPSGYTLTGAGAPIGGTVHLAAAPQVGAKVRVRGVSAANASEEVVRGVRYNYLTVEQALLRLGWGLQEVSRDAATVLTVAEGLTEAVDLASEKAATAVSAAQSAVASAQSAAQSAEDAAATAALFDPTSFYLKTAFRSDGTASAPVKYDANGALIAKAFKVDNVGSATSSILSISANADQWGAINFYSGTTQKYGLARNPDNTFSLYNAAAGTYAWLVGPTNVVDFINAPTVAGVAMPTSTGVKKRVSSSLFTITVGSLLTWAHGLPAAPSRTWTTVVCQVAEFGYSVGEEVEVPPIYNSGNGAGQGVQLKSDASNVYGRIGSGGFVLYNWTTGSAITPTAVNWRVRLWAEL